eukprot:gene5889-28696_t
MKDGRKAVGVAAKKNHAERAACFQACVLSGAKPRREKNDIFIPEQVQQLTFRQPSVNSCFQALDWYQRELAAQPFDPSTWDTSQNFDADAAIKKLPVAWDPRFLGSGANAKVESEREAARQNPSYIAALPARKTLTVAERVAQERGEVVGQTIGYTVRLSGVVA